MFFHFLYDSGYSSYPNVHDEVSVSNDKTAKNQLFGARYRAIPAASDGPSN